jgi:hypothetical protein
LKRWQLHSERLFPPLSSQYLLRKSAKTTEISSEIYAKSSSQRLCVS